MSSTSWGLESGAGNWLLESGAGDWLLEDATTFAVSDTLTIVYDILAIVSDTLTIVYDMTGVVGDTITLCYDINGDASTQLTQVKKSFTPVALDTEYTLVQRTDGPFHYAFWVSLANMQSGDTVKIRVYRWEPNTSAFQLYEVKTIKHSDLKGNETENQPAVFLPFIPVERYKVTIEQTDGTLRTYPWELYRTS